MAGQTEDPQDLYHKTDIAQRCEFSAPIVYTCVLKPNLTFANGHDLTSADVKFSFDRERTIDDPNGPQSLLANLDSIATPDPLTVNFTLKLPNDQTFPQVLATNATLQKGLLALVRPGSGRA